MRKGYIRGTIKDSHLVRKHIDSSSAKRQKGLEKEGRRRSRSGKRRWRRRRRRSTRRMWGRRRSVKRGTKS